MLTVNVQGLPAALHMVELLQRRLLNLDPLFRDISHVLERNAELRFDTKTDPDGHAWPAWAKSTAAARAREGRGTLMEHSGHTRASLDSAFGPTFAEVWLGTPYADYSESVDPRIRLPRRGLLLSDSGELGKQDSDDVLKLVEDLFNV